MKHYIQNEKSTRQIGGASMKLTIIINLDDSKLHDENGYFDAVPEIKRTLALIDDDALQEGEILDGDNSIGIIALD